MKAAIESMQTNGCGVGDQKGNIGAPELPSFHGCIECTATHATLPSGGNPETT